MPAPNVWLDEWNIQPGESIPGAVNAALGLANPVLIMWSQNAKRSRSVEAEMNSTFARYLRDGSVQPVLVRLDDTNPPDLLADGLWVDMPEGTSPENVVRKIMGYETREAFIRAVQQAIGETELRFEYFPGFGVAVGCPRCGADVEQLEYIEHVDYVRDDRYAGVICQGCGWSDGGEV
ncbi:toll/interleukin-1 receptor domain-containing protein [Nonomuraea sp. NPDC049400]|uniref:toll/interleukin-1 receptor domain-containing protein n=1 Tax=Nonomuraea sp. NPDC049400 TaxID=3364352 RepID=UPI003799A9DD